MIGATLGGLIKSYRIKKRLSQLDIALSLGWKDTTRLSKIEQGRVGNPSRELIDKIIKALDLTEQEKGEFLLAGGYVPTDAEILGVIKTLKEKILSWPHPAYLMDFSWRVLFMNQPTIDILGYSQDFLTQAHKIKMNVLELVALPKDYEIFKGDDKDSLKPLEETLVAQFKAEHIGKENEKWYKQLIAKLAHQEKFRDLWSTIDVKDYHKKLYEYEYKQIFWPKLKKKKAFHIFDSKLVKDKRFSTTFYLPAEF